MKDYDSIGHCREKGSNGKTERGEKFFRIKGAAGDILIDINKKEVLSREKLELQINGEI